RATARDLEKRYESARDLADVVEAHLAGDRDLELRRELAARHLVSARDASARALADAASEADRALALRETGCAIALSPDDDEARHLLVRLLTTPPKSPPREVLDEVEDTRIATLHTTRRAAAVMYSSFGLVVGAL